MDGKETKRKEVTDLLDDWTEEGIPHLSYSDSSEEESDEESEEEDIPEMNERAFRVTSVTNARRKLMNERIKNSEVKIEDDGKKRLFTQVISN